MQHERWKANITVAAVIAEGDRFLLVQEHTPEGLRLNNPAGHLEQGETPLEAVLREVVEETARDFTPQALLGLYLSRFVRGSGATREDVTYLRIAYAGTVGAPVPGRPLDEGIVRTLWLTPAQIRERSAELRSPLVLRCIDDHLAGVRHPLGLVQADPSVHAPWRIDPASP